MKRFILTVEGPNLQDSQEVELPQLPVVGQPIETRYGTCLIVETKSFDEGQFAGQIICRLP